MRADTKTVCYKDDLSLSNRCNSLFYGRPLPAFIVDLLHYKLWQLDNVQESAWTAWEVHHMVQERSNGGKKCPQPNNNVYYTLYCVCVVLQRPLEPHPWARTTAVMSSRSPPPPSLPEGPAHRLANNYYVSRDDRRRVTPPEVLSTHKQLREGSDQLSR